MPIVQHNPAGLFPPYRAYSHAIEISGTAKLLVISGLNGYESDGLTMPESFDEQGNLIWNYMGTLLHAAGMDYSNLVSVRTYLADPAYDEQIVQLRLRYLRNHRPALTVVCCQLLEPKWKLEVEAMAAG